MKIRIINHIFPKVTLMTLTGKLECSDQLRIEQYIRTLLFEPRVLLVDCLALELPDTLSLTQLISSLQRIQGDKGRLCMIPPHVDAIEILNMLTAPQPRWFDSVESALQTLTLEAA